MKGIFLDTEANGLDPFVHTICEIGIQIVDMETGTLGPSYSSPVYLSEEEWEASQAESLHINGFTYDMVRNAPTRDEVAQAILSLFEKEGLIRGESVFICQNPSFDRVFFSKLIPSNVQEKRNFPYHWLDLASMHWALSIKSGQILPWTVGLSKNKISAFYKIAPEGIPHRAINGVHHLLSCYEAVVGFPNKEK